MIRVKELMRLKEALRQEFYYHVSEEYRAEVDILVRMIQSTRIEQRAELTETEQLKRGMALEISAINDPETRRRMLYLGQGSIPQSMQSKGDKGHELFSWNYPGVDPKHFRVARFYQIPHSTFRGIPENELFKSLTPTSLVRHCFPFTRREARAICDIVYER